MAKYDGLLGQPVLEVEEPDKEGGITIILKDNRFMFIKAVDGKIETVSIPEQFKMAKFDGIRMQDLIEVQDPDEEGGLTLVFKDDIRLKIKIVDGKLVSESIPEQINHLEFLHTGKSFLLVHMTELSHVFFP